jgi:hypothetical protein
VGLGRLPLWLDEGMAVYMETKCGSSPYRYAIAILKNAIKNNHYIKFSELSQMNPLTISSGASQDYVDLFYIESFSLVTFLIERYGRDSFVQFLFYLRNGSDVQSALPKGFSSLRTFNDLENAWKKFYLD